MIANAGLAGLLALLARIYPAQTELLRLMVAAGFAAAAADTVSSELGNVYGKKYYNILSLRPDVRGLNGVISIEGSLFGLLGSMIIAATYSFGFQWSILLTALFWLLP